MKAWLPLLGFLVPLSAGCAVAHADHGSSDQDQTSSQDELTAWSPYDLRDVYAKSVSVGLHHTCARLTDDRVACWGSNLHGEIVPGAPTARPYSNATIVNGLAGVSAVSAGAAHVCAIVGPDRVVQCWGSNADLQSGGGTMMNGLGLTAVKGMTGALAVSAGPSHTCANVPSANGGTALFCWGARDENLLGDGFFGYGVTDIPARVWLGDAATTISAGDGFSCFDHAVSSAGPAGVACFGRRYIGSPSPPYWTSRAAATYPVLQGDATSIGVGDVHACTVVSGSVYCWGRSTDGQTGALSEIEFLPRLVLTGATKVVAGSAHSCALLVGGTVKCWGNDLRGQLGNGTTASSPTPVDVAGLTGVTDLSANVATTCAVAGGRVYCWGYNPYGQIGDGSVGTVRLLPTRARWPELVKAAL